MTNKLYLKKHPQIFYLFLLICIVFLFCGCNTNISNNNELSLSEEQSIAYKEVTSYATNCKSSELNTTLQEIKMDIKKYKNTKNEIEIGKKKIDILSLRVSKENDISSATSEAYKKKENYRKQMNSIIFIYQGTENMYKAEVYALESKISAAYSQALQDIQRNSNNPSNATGTKERYRRERMSQYQNEVRYYQYQLDDLKERWNNKVQYDKLKKLYEEVEDNLSIEKQSIETKYEKIINEKNKHLETYYKLRY